MVLHEGLAVIGYVVRRIFQSFFVLLGVTIIVFVLEHLVPGSLARAVLGPRASGLEVAAFDRANGLDHPVVVQYLLFLGHLFEGNLGRSYRLNESVSTVIGDELPNDVFLVGIALVLALVIAIPVGVAQALRRNKPFDVAASGFFFALYSTPSYCLGLLLLAAFAIGTHTFPPEAPQASSIGAVLAEPRALVLPVLTLALVNVALFSRYMRSSVMTTLAEDFVLVAKAKGLSRWQVIRRHVMRSSLGAVVTIVGLSLPGVITAGLVVEYLFNYPGVGLTYFTSAVNSDYPVMLGVTVLVGLATVCGNLLADVAYAALDPRIRYG